MLLDSGYSTNGRRGYNSENEYNTIARGGYNRRLLKS